MPWVGPLKKKERKEERKVERKGGKEEGRKEKKGEKKKRNARPRRIITQYQLPLNYGCDDTMKRKFTLDAW